jgi:hypothetical protein
LEKKIPSWELFRWKSNKGLRFVPPDDEGFTLRGDRRRLLYKGRRRSHRFTILGDTSFEYDCILEKEPESNIISLRMEGAENFDFFRQPDFVSEPFLKGSYAVYKKDTLIGEGTGKLCHIHRPEIIDARGRRCWGSLAVVGNELRITIPEWWLSGAEYPVVVDPVIGTNTVGSQYLWDADPPEPLSPLYLEVAIAVNRFLVSETLSGLCTAYLYTNDDDGEAYGFPVCYSDNNNVPQYRKTNGEKLINLRVTGSNPKGWRSGTFNMSDCIQSGSYIWFGCVACYMWYPRFDYGAKCYIDDWRDYATIPNTYPVYNPNIYYDFKLSMYFDYVSSQNNVRTITQGVALADANKLKIDYKRSLPQTAQINSGVNYKWVLKAKIIDTIQAAGTVFRGLIFTAHILTKLITRDYLLGRFIKSKQELVIKSIISHEIVIDSKMVKK